METGHQDIVPALVGQPTTRPTDQLSSNDYNPNQMTAEEFAELVAEVRHLGRLPKPIVVRPDGVIVDGEHGWRAAKEVGLATVPCEVIDADGFECMRQTYKRNQHGKHDSVKLGHMFRRMMAERGLSQRALATEMTVSEGTIRNALAYAEALEVRNRYAPDKPEENAREIAKLPVRQVRDYLDLPPPIGDFWLDCGGEGTKVRADPYGSRFFHAGHDADYAFETLAEIAKPPYLDVLRLLFKRRRGLGGFGGALRKIVDLYRWREKNPDATGIENYIASLGSLISEGWGLWPGSSLSAFLEEWLLFDKQTGRVVITVEEWTDVLNQCAGRTTTKKFHGEGGLDELVKLALDLLYEKKGVRKVDLSDPRQMRNQGIINRSPSWLRDAENLSFQQKTDLAEILADPEKEFSVRSLFGNRTVTLQEAREKLGADRVDTIMRKAIAEAAPSEESYCGGYADFRAALGDALLDDLLHSSVTKNPLELVDRIVAAIPTQDRQTDEEIKLEENGKTRLLKDVLWKRLSIMPLPELVLLHTVFHRDLWGWPEVYLRALKKEASAQPQPGRVFVAGDNGIAVQPVPPPEGAAAAEEVRL